jgi:hypothetical protein
VTIATISNKDRFPHYKELLRLGENTDEARWYNQVYSNLLNKEYEFLVETVTIRETFGGNKIIHNGRCKQR